MNKVLLTGAAGFVGSNLARRLAKEGKDVHIVVRQQSRLDLLEDMIPNIGIHVHNGTTENMIEIVEAVKPDIVFHLAAFFVAEHKSVDVQSLINSNILFGAQLLEGMKSAGVNYLINAGTSWQHYDSLPYSPVNLYAATKQSFEAISKYYTEASPMRMLTLKLIDTYGPFDPRSKILSLFKRISRTEEILKMSGGEQNLGLVYIDDVLEAFMYAMQYISNMPEHYNNDFCITPVRYYKLREVAAIYEEVSSIKLNIEWGARPYRAREMMLPYSGNALGGWRAKIDLKEGIAKMLEKESMK